jgi:S1-C subfamily serine protease
MIVVAVAGEPVTGADDVVRLLDGERIGIPTGLSVVSDGKLRTIIIVPDERDQH